MEELLIQPGSSRREGSLDWLIRELLSQDEDEDSLDWLGDPLTPTSTQGPWRFETEFTDLTDEEDPEETLPSIFAASLGELVEITYAESDEEDRVVTHNVRRVTRSQTLLTRSLVNLLLNIEDTEDD